MIKKTRVCVVAALCILFVSVMALPGCGVKRSDAVTSPAPHANQKMGEDYGKGVAAAHANPH